jgi:hypothetical protein
MERFDPFTGGQRAQDWIGRWPHEGESRRRFAAQAADVWAEWLKWPSLLANMKLNEFYTDVELMRFNIHYSFLSGLMHPAKRSGEALYSRNLPMSLGYDHYVSELILLYVTTIARLELGVFEEMTTRAPEVELHGWDDVREDMRLGEELAAHLWFPRGSPHSFDRIQEANRRGVGADGRPMRLDERIKPQELADNDVLYYANPLKRLVRMHANENELTAFPYVSPWPRGDAQIRGLY